MLLISTIWIFEKTKERMRNPNNREISLISSIKWAKNKGNRNFSNQIHCVRFHEVMASHAKTKEKKLILTYYVDVDNLSMLVGDLFSRHSCLLKKLENLLNVEKSNSFQQLKAEKKTARTTFWGREKRKSKAFITTLNNVRKR